MNTLHSIASSLRQGRKTPVDVHLAQQTGLSRQSLKKALSGTANFNVTTLLAIAEANGQEILVVPKALAQALAGSGSPPQSHVATVSSELRGL